MRSSALREASSSKQRSAAPASSLDICNASAYVSLLEYGMAGFPTSNMTVSVSRSSPCSALPGGRFTCAAASAGKGGEEPVGIRLGCAALGVEGALDSIESIEEGANI